MYIVQEHITILFINLSPLSLSLSLSLSEDDLKLHGQLFDWPNKIDPIFEVCHHRLVNKRQEVEDALKERRNAFAKTLEEYEEEIESFREKEVSGRGRYGCGDTFNASVVVTVKHVHVIHCGDLMYMYMYMYLSFFTCDYMYMCIHVLYKTLYMYCTVHVLMLY